MNECTLYQQGTDHVKTMEGAERCFESNDNSAG